MQQRPQKPPMPNWSGLSKNLALWLLVALLAVTLFQLMQNVFTEFRLEGEFNQANPRNGGWIQVFYKWLQSDLLYNQIWPRLRNDYHAIFGQFVDGLQRNGIPDTPPRP